MNTNNIKVKTLSIGEFKFYSDNGILKVSRNGQIFIPLEEKKNIDRSGFFSTKNSEVLKLIRKLYKCVKK